MKIGKETSFGWFGVVLNILCLIVFEATGLADDTIAGSFVYNLIGCIVWLVAIRLNFPLLLILHLIWFSIPLSLWAIYISFALHGVLSGDSYYGYRSRGSYSFFWSGVFILVLSAIYYYLALKIYLRFRKSRELNGQIIALNPPPYTSALMTKTENV